MSRRYIPTDYEEEMLDAIAEISGHFAQCAYEVLDERKRQALYLICGKYVICIMKETSTSSQIYTLRNIRQY